MFPDGIVWTDIVETDGFLLHFKLFAYLFFKKKRYGELKDGIILWVETSLGDFR